MNSIGERVGKVKTGRTPGKKPMSVRVATKADGKDLNDLYNKVFKEERSLAYWHWQFSEGLAQDWPIAYTVAEIDGQIIGQYPSQIRSMFVEEKPVRFALGMDNMVAEEFRSGYPAQKEMFALTCRTTAENDIAIGYGFPNERHYKVGKRLLGYRDVARLPELFYRLSWRPAIAKRLPWLPKTVLALFDKVSRKRLGQRQAFCAGDLVTVESVDCFPTEMDHLWERLKTRRTICAERDSAFLNWRFGRDDLIPYRKLVARNQAGTIAGYLVCRIMPVNGDRVGYLVDFLFESDQVLAHLLSEALAFLHREKADYVSVMISPGTPEALSLEKLGFKVKAGFGGRPLIVVDLTGTLPFDVILDPTRWYLTYGDSDLA